MERNLYSCIKFLENNGQLVRVQERLSPHYEVAAALRYLEQKSGKAVLLEKIEGYDDVVILGNLFSDRRRLALLMNVPEDRLIENYQERMAVSVPPRVMNAQLGDVGLTQLEKPETTAMPVLTHHAKDAAPYLTSAVV
ncbi:MAG: UbiD family decarboxylase, partial [Syntrophales bacterium]|nr:UbiD family decarboxylase [Syntrophales bacterium]